MFNILEFRTSEGQKVHQNVRSSVRRYRRIGAGYRVLLTEDGTGRDAPFLQGSPCRSLVAETAGPSRAPGPPGDTPDARRGTRAARRPRRRSSTSRPPLRSTSPITPPPTPRPRPPSRPRASPWPRVLVLLGRACPCRRRPRATRAARRQPEEGRGRRRAARARARAR